MSYELALKQHYSDIHARLMQRPAPTLRLVTSRPRVETWPEQPEPVLYDDCVPTAMVLEVPKRPWRDVAQDVARRHNIAVADILSKSRALAVVIARQELYYLMHDEGRRSYCEVGRLLGVDHSTVVHGCHKHITRAGLPPERIALRPGSFWTAERKGKAIDMREAGATNSEIAAALGSTPRRVKEMFVRHKIRGIKVRKEIAFRKVSYAGAGGEA